LFTSEAIENALALCDKFAVLRWVCDISVRWAMQMSGVALFSVNHLKHASAYTSEQWENK